MIKIVLFDADGMIIKREMYFSQRLSQEFNIPLEKIMQFFKNEFPLCLVGQADLKVELAKYLKLWGWKKSVDDLLDFWFKNESQLDEQMLNSIKKLRNNGIGCYLDTNNEKYRVNYLWRTLGLKDNFDGLFSSAEIGFKKSKPEFWSAVYNRLNEIDKSAVLIWDDAKENVEAAKNFGFKAELYQGWKEYEEFVRLIVED